MGIFGKALFDYHSGEENAEITVLSPDFEPDIIPVKYLLRDYSTMPDIEQLALKKCQGKILDIGACAGAHSAFLQQHGHEVVALEQDQICCQYLKSVRNIKNVIEANFLTWTSTEKFDTLLLLMNGSGFAGTIDNIEGFIEHCGTYLEDGGQILMDSTDVVYLYEMEDGSLELPFNNYYGEMQYQLSYKGEISETFPWLYIDYNLLEEKLESKGWKVELLQQQNDFSYLVKISK